MIATPAQDIMLDVQQVCTRLHVTRKVVYNLMTARKLKFIRVGPKAIRFRPEWVDAFIDQLPEKR